MTTPTYADWRTNLEDFRAEFAANWQYDCNLIGMDQLSINNHQPESKRMKDYQTVAGSVFQQALIENTLIAAQNGLKSLEDVNPALFQKVSYKFKNKPLGFKCTRLIEDAAAVYNAYDYDIPYVLLYNKGIFHLLKSVHQGKVNPYIQAIILHEIYHHAELDNLHYTAHNKFKRQYHWGSYLKDVVYACVAQTYGKTTKYHLDTTAEGIGLSNSHRICSVCANAVPTEKGTELDINNMQVNRYCSSLKDGEYYIGYFEDHSKLKLNYTFKQGFNTDNFVATPALPKISTLADNTRPPIPTPIEDNLSSKEEPTVLSTKQPIADDEPIEVEISHSDNYRRKEIRTDSGGSAVIEWSH